MKKEFKDQNGNLLKLDTDAKKLYMIDLEFVFRNPKEMIEFAAAINIIANRWINNMSDEFWDIARSIPE